MDKRFAWIKSSLFIKLGIILILALMILVPINNAKKLLREREERQRQTAEEVVHAWGGEKRISGPVLAIPFSYEISFYNKEGYLEQEIRDDVMYLLSDKLKIIGDVHTEIRKKGIYEIPLYRSSFQMEGAFEDIQFPKNNYQRLKIHWEGSYLLLSVGDPRGLDYIDIKSAGEALQIEKGIEGDSGLSYPLQADLQVSPGRNLSFSIQIEANGGKSLTFIPGGGDTQVHLQSDWPSPDFFGSYLPFTRELQADGFTSVWTMGSLSRSAPSFWAGKDGQGSSLSGAFGYRYKSVVDHYHKTERAIKYGFLFVCLPFLVMFLIEIFHKKSFHPMQYLFVGLAVSFFFLLLLSLSEHLGFWVGYFLSSVATTVVITLYSGGFLQGLWVRSSLSGVLVALYGYLFFALQSEDYALLIGSLGLFGLFAIIMIATRNLNWSALGQEAKE